MTNSTFLEGLEDFGKASEDEYDGQNELKAEGNIKKPNPQRDSWMTANEKSGRNILTGELQNSEPKEFKEDVSKDGPKHQVRPQYVSFSLFIIRLKGSLPNDHADLHHTSEILRQDFDLSPLCNPALIDCYFYHFWPSICPRSETLDYVLAVMLTEFRFQLIKICLDAYLE